MRNRVTVTFPQRAILNVHVARIGFQRLCTLLPDVVFGFQGPSVWLALVFNNMETNRFKGLIAIILRRFGNLERAPKFSP
jgi:hypothetical protein